MSDVNMRKLMEAVDSFLMEDYYDRVDDIAKGVINTYGPVSSNEVRNLVYSYAMDKNVPEARFGKDSKQFKEFLKDVMAKLKMAGHIKRNPSHSARAPYYVLGSDGETRKPVTHEDIQKLGRYMADAAGQTFPDGDPNDLLTNYFQHQGWDSYDAFQKLVPIASKKVLGTKDYYTYLADMWDQVYADAKSDYETAVSAATAAKPIDPHARYMYDMLGGDNAVNPWR